MSPLKRAIHIMVERMIVENHEDDKKIKLTDNTFWWINFLAFASLIEEVKVVHGMATSG